MKIAAVLAVCSIAGLTLFNTTVIAASPRPSIAILSPAPGAVLHGPQLTVRVHVADFRLVPPVLNNPPVLKGDAGHIHYVLDGSTVFAQSAGTSYTWPHAAPGRHTITAYLATSQHAAFPGVHAASVTVTIQAPPAPRPAKKPAPAPAPGIKHAPTTGGGADAASAPLNFSLLLAGLLSILLGISFLTTRLGFGRAARRGNRSSATAASPVLTNALQSQESTTTFGDSVRTEPPPEPLVGAENGPAVFGAEATMAPSEAQLVVGQAALPPPPLPPVADTAEGGEIRSQAVAMAQQWTEMVDGLLNQLNQQEEERRQLLSRIQAMEQALEADRALRERLETTSTNAVAGEELQKLRYVTDSLIDDPDHIVVLAAVAQHAGPLRRIVEDYARIRQVIDSH